MSASSHASFLIYFYFGLSSGRSFVFIILGTNPCLFESGDRGAWANAFACAEVFMFQIVNAAFGGVYEAGKLGLGPLTWRSNEPFYIVALMRVDRSHQKFSTKKTRSV